MILKRSSEYDGDTKDFDNIIEAMEECRIFKIKKESDGLFGITESCDNFYGVSLSKEQLIDLGYALISFAEKSNHEKPRISDYRIKTNYLLKQYELVKGFCCDCDLLHKTICLQDDIRQCHDFNEPYCWKEVK